MSADENDQTTPAPAPDGPDQAGASSPDAGEAGGEDRPEGGLRRWMPRRRPSARPEPSASDERTASGEPAASENATGGTPADPPPAEGTPDGEPEAGDAASAPAGPRRTRRWPRRRTLPDAGDAEQADEPAGEGAAADDPPVDGAAAEGSPGRLRRRRKHLLDDREMAVYHLGGLCFELYRRDLVTEEVLRLRAGRIALIDEAIHDIDTRLEQVDAERRERRARRSGEAPVVAGNCLTCRAPFQAGARFCSQCGVRLAPADPASDEQVTEAITTRVT